MEPTKSLRDNDRRTYTALAAGLSIFALLSLRRGKRLRGVLAGAGAVALGYSASSKSGDAVEHVAAELDTGSTTGDDHRRCAACGDLIVAGQSRVPNEAHETVHEACLGSPA